MLIHSIFVTWKLKPSSFLCWPWWLSMVCGIPAVLRASPRVLCSLPVGTQKQTCSTCCFTRLCLPGASEHWLTPGLSSDVSSKRPFLIAIPCPFPQPRCSSCALCAHPAPQLCGMLWLWILFINLTSMGLSTGWAHRGLSWSLLNEWYTSVGDRVLLYQCDQVKTLILGYRDHQI